MNEKREARIRRKVNLASAFVAVLAALQTIFAGLMVGWTHPVTLLIPPMAIVVIPLGRWFLTWFVLRALKRRG